MSLEESLTSRMLAAHPDEAAAELEVLPDHEVLAVLANAPSAVAAEVLVRLAPLRAAGALSHLDGALAHEVVQHIGLDRAADLVRRMEVDERSGFLESLESDVVGSLEALIAFPDGTAGSLMDTRVLALPVDVTAADAVTRIREEPESVRYNLYVVDRQRRLIGVLNLRELLLADPEQTLESIAHRDVMSIDGYSDSDAIMAHPAWREAHSLPVVDRRGVYLGAIRYRTLRRLERARFRSRRESPTADALGDLFSTGVEGLLGALTHMVAPAAEGGSDVED